MKKRLYILLSALTYTFFSCNPDRVVIDEINPNDERIEADATFRSKKEAAEVAKTFIQEKQILGIKTKSTNLGLDFITSDVIGTKSSNQTPAYYIFNVNKGGFVIVSASKVAIPILGYSNEGSYNLNNVPVNMTGILNRYSNEINDSRKRGLIVTEEIKRANETFLTEGVKTKTRNSISPLTADIKWTQRPHYNKYCPKNTPVGCTAIATAIIMRYHKYPKKGTGNIKWKHSNYGWQRFRYNFELDWNAMPKATLTEHNRKTAIFCSSVAVGLKTNFSPNSSGAFQKNVPKLLKTYFKYPNNVANAFRDDYSDSDWKKLIYGELAAGRPVQYEGKSTSGTGHSFVCDGYNSDTEFFHFNWGWGGLHNGYFQIDALNPANREQSSGYNNFHQAVINFAPPEEGIDLPNPDQVTHNYCTSTSRKKRCYISNVKVGSIQFSSYIGSGYSDYTSKLFNIKRGQKTAYRLTPGFKGLKPWVKLHWRIFIDTNNNGKFENNEQYGSYKGNNVGTNNLVLPETISKGEYRMRVSMKLRSYPDACENFYTGEVEDYKVNVY